jgi:hypothetical protein
LILLEKEFKDRHRDFSRSSFTNTKQGKSALSRWEGGQAQGGAL